MAESGNSRAPSPCFRRRVAVRRYKARAGQHRAHGFALHADSAPVNDADGTKAELLRFLEVGLDHALDIARRHAVQVEDIRDGDPDWFAGIRTITRHILSLYNVRGLISRVPWTSRSIQVQVPAPEAELPELD